MALLRRRTKTVQPLDGVDAVLVDLDGVVYAGHAAIPHAVESLNRVAESIRVGYITNNASRTDATVAEQLSGFGLGAKASDIVTSPQAAVRLLRDRVSDGALVLVVGGEGLINELTKAGYRVTRKAEDGPDAVVQGFAPDVDWNQLAEAAYALQTDGEPNEIPWIATNTDWTIPRERGIAPGNGTLVSAVHTAVGRLAEVAGKPEVPIFEEAKRRFDAQNPLMIGDRLDTDILGANRAGIDSVLVLTGVDRAKHVLAAGTDERPTYVVRDLRELFEPYPVTQFSRDKSEATVGDATVRINGTEVEIARAGDSDLNRLRAASAVIWASGRQIFGFNVPERLYA
ncbi:Haloacid Dehalogenase Superfamily Class (subfamily) IIA [Paramicrobacterium humi]|uniref:Haloacid Dehalogenase Superfamily Class (Subfamily) IIA n=1 Tax=Paramicrobacterium humi TaxID=640635 RepID=A0A1H4PX61_9MICO|nr:HAD-IIA family hydrolase [Microbacterium humi]SEC11973.1 Haloacid Dehalogenase Superfamily Class (subfamily) IIA [Microbacterium humi]